VLRNFSRHLLDSQWLIDNFFYCNSYDAFLFRSRVVVPNRESAEPLQNSTIVPSSLVTKFRLRMSKNSFTSPWGECKTLPAISDPGRPRARQKRPLSRICRQVRMINGGDSASELCDSAMRDFSSEAQREANRDKTKGS